MAKEFYCRYKKGDIVQIRPDLSVSEQYRMPSLRGYQPWEICEGRLCYCGWFATIIDIVNFRYKLDVDIGSYYWCDDMRVSEDDLQVNKEVCEQELTSLLCL